mmetsp:Transcript_8010/g.19538  ORF Transcript_8010/g.19538 Transcript_8010/m.19538 type:complete len:218 (+) Transcript_8010:223-876(+)
MRSHSLSASSVGGSPFSTRTAASWSTASFASFSRSSFIPVAWYMESSDTHAISLRVTLLMRAWYSLTVLAISSVSPRPSTAWMRSRSEREPTSSRTSSFSRSCSFFRFSLSSSWVILVAMSSGLRSFPPSSLYRCSLEGVSNSNESTSERLRSSSSWMRRASISPRYRGICGRSLVVTPYSHSCFESSKRSTRISSSLAWSSSSPLRRICSWMLHFS